MYHNAFSTSPFANFCLHPKNLGKCHFLDCHGLFWTLFWPVNVLYPFVFIICRLWQFSVLKTSINLSETEAYLTNFHSPEHYLFQRKPKTWRKEGLFFNQRFCSLSYRWNSMEKSFRTLHSICISCQFV